MLGTDTAIPQDVLEHLHVGMSVTLTMDTGDRYLAKIVGWKTGDSIILEIPKAYEASVGDLFTMKRSPFQAQRETVVRFVSDGIAYGFRQTIAEIVT